MSELVVEFDEQGVREWCADYGAELAGDKSFSEPTIPSLMLLNPLEGMVAELGEDDEEVLIGGVTAARFRDPVLLDETVTFTLSEVEEGQYYDGVDFEARVEERDSLVATGSLSIVTN